MWFYVSRINLCTQIVCNFIDWIFFFPPNSFISSRGQKSFFTFTLDLVECCMYLFGLQCDVWLPKYLFLSPYLSRLNTRSRAPLLRRPFLLLGYSHLPRGCPSPHGPVPHGGVGGHICARFKAPCSSFCISCHHVFPQTSTLSSCMSIFHPQFSFSSCIKAPNFLACQYHLSTPIPKEEKSSSEIFILLNNWTFCQGWKESQCNLP